MNHNNKNVSRIQTTHIKKQHLLVINVSGGAVHMPQQKPTILPAHHHQNSIDLTINIFHEYAVPMVRTVF